MGSHRRSFRELHPLSREELDGQAYGWMHGWDHAWSVRRTHAPHRQQCLSPRQRWRSSTSSTSTLIFPSHHPLHVSHITAMPEKNVCRYLNKVDSRWRACVTITRYTCILDVTLDPPKRVDYYPNYEIHFYYSLVIHANSSTFS